MPLSVPTNYANASKLKNIQENWVFHLYYGDESNFTPISMSDTIIDGVKYRGIVTNTPSIRNSIDLFKSTSKTSNLSLNMINYKYRDNSLDDTIFSRTINKWSGATPTDLDNLYIGRKILVYSQLNNASALSDCLLLFTGTIKSLSHTIDNITLSAMSKNIWDGIEIGAEKTTSGSNYVPIAFGEFEDSPLTYYDINIEDDINVSAKFLPDELTNKKLRPVPYSPIVPTDNVVGFSFPRIAYLIGNQSYDHNVGSGTNEAGKCNAPLEYYDSSNDAFIPLVNLTKTDGQLLDGYPIWDYESQSHDGTQAFLTTRGIRRGFSIRPDSVEQTHTDYDYNIDFDESYPLTNAIDGDPATYALIDFDSSAGQYIHRSRHRLKFKTPDGSLSCIEDGTLDNWKATIFIKFQFYDGYNSNGTFASNWYINIAGGGNDYNFTIPASETDEDDNEQFLQLNTPVGATDMELFIEGYTYVGTTRVKLKINDIYMSYEYSLKSEKEGDNPRYYTGKPPEFLYSGVGGEYPTYTGSAGTDPISKAHEAHRELLYRYTDIGTSTPVGFNSLESSRSNFVIRDWINEPESLKKKLEQYQYEGCFIFTNENNTPKYIYVKNAYGSDEEDHLLDDKDFSSIDVTLTDDVVTRWEVEYERHPANNKYLHKIESNTEYRSVFGHGFTKENVKSVKLDVLVQKDVLSYVDFDLITPIALTHESDGDLVEGANTEFGFLCYYNKLHSQPREVVSLNIINPKFYNIQCGDIVRFKVSETNFIFGDNINSIVFMVVDVKKQVGSVKIKAMNVGA